MAKRLFITLLLLSQIASFGVARAQSYVPSTRGDFPGIKAAMGSALPYSFVGVRNDANTSGYTQSTNLVESYRVTYICPPTSGLSNLQLIYWNGYRSSTAAEIGVGNTVTFTAGVEAGGCITAAIASGGSGYTNGTYALTASGGNGSGFAGTISVVSRRSNNDHNHRSGRRLHIDPYDGLVAFLEAVRVSRIRSLTVVFIRNK